MKPVNLLPSGQRSAVAGRARRGHVALGVLAALVALVGLWVYFGNQATERRNEAALLNAASDRLEAQTRTTSGMVDYSALRRERTEALRQVAASRVDWERLVRETGRVLPDRVWLTSLDAKGAADAAAATGATTAPAPAVSPAGGPTVSLSGCAPSHRRVADTLVRLRQLHSAHDVELIESMREGAPAGGAPAAGNSTAAPPPPSGSLGPTGCGETGGRPNVSFKLAVRLDAPTPSSGDLEVDARVPAWLGGGQ